MQLQYTLAVLLSVIAMSTTARAQHYSRVPVCGTDTIHVNYSNMRSVKTIHYDAFLCSCISKWGIRAEVGRSSYRYTTATNRWLGKHAGGSFALHVAYGKWNVGARAVLTSTNPQMPLTVDGQTLPTAARLNPAKIEYSIGYTQHIVANICTEPFIGITSNKFYVTNEDTLKAHYQIPQVNALTMGIGLHKYFTVAKYQYVCAFVRYAHCFANFAKVNPTLGRGYNEWTAGIAFKAFGERKYHKVISGALPSPK
jgi:hypothetical protein